MSEESSKGVNFPKDFVEKVIFTVDKIVFVLCLVWMFNIGYEHYVSDIALPALFFLEPVITYLASASALICVTVIRRILS